MYVRWKRRAQKKTSRWNPDPQLLAAYLVESRRVDGKPRQRVVAYLGSIGEGFLGEAGPRAYFWRQANSRLDALALSPPARATVESALLQVVRRPSADELNDASSHLRELEALRLRP